MTQRHGDGSDGSAEGLLQIAVENYQDALEDLADMKAAVRASERYSDAEARKIVSMVSKTIQNIFEERKRLDEFRKSQDGDGGGIALDFDSARAEIRRRLDRIRTARGAGEVSQ